MRSLYILLVLFTACHEAPIKYPDGGYNYVAKINKQDSSFWYLPAKDSMPSDDSFIVAYHSSILAKAFNEPNISLGPAPSEIFRFYYSGLGGEEIFITLTRNEIVIKQGKAGELYAYDESQLTEQELIHLNLLDRDFPLHKKNRSSKRQRFLDSMVTIHPQLLDAKYYARLCDKVYRPGKNPFTFTTKKYRIGTSTFKKWVDTLNASDYWSYPYDHKCVGRGTATHMAGYILEANTRHKYNVVRYHTCACDTSAYVRACNQLAILAGLEKEFDLIWGCD